MATIGGRSTPCSSGWDWWNNDTKRSSRSWAERRSPTSPRRYGVTRQTVHRWLRRYARSGLGGLVDHPSRPASCPHQMPPEVEARIVELRRAHPRLGPAHHPPPAHPGRHCSLCPGRSSIYRCLVRHGLVDPQKRHRKRREDYRRWERSRSMELWQMDVMGGVKLDGGRELKIVTGLDDHSRFCVSAMLVPRATARPVCEALAARHAPLWGARADPHRQREGVHQPLRSGQGGGAL